MLGQEIETKYVHEEKKSHTNLKQFIKIKK